MLGRGLAGKIKSAPSSQPSLRAPALAVAQGRSMGSEPVVRKLPLSPRKREKEQRPL